MEIVQRWHQLFKGSLLTQRFARDEALSQAELDVAHTVADEWRERLHDMSWFMRVLNRE